jgi:hypothetical protein
MTPDKILNDTMETGDHPKNGASPKSHTSRGNFLHLVQKLFFVFSLFTLFHACEKEDAKNDNNTELSEEEVTTFYTKMESFVDLPDFRSGLSLEEQQPLMENWLRQQPEVASVTVDGNILTFKLANGSVTEVEFTVPEEMDEPLDFEPETVDGSYFTDSNASEAIFQEQVITKAPSRAETDDSPDYIYPVFWEPSLEISLKTRLEECFNKSPCHKYSALAAQDITCNPLSLKDYLRPAGANINKPNLIFISTHGSPGRLDIGCCKKRGTVRSVVWDKTQPDLVNIQDKLKRQYGIDISQRPTKVRINPDGTRYLINITAADLAKLLQGVDLSNSIVFLTVCNSLTNTALAKVFIDRGATYVYGYNGAPNNWGNITQTLLYHLVAPRHLDSNPLVIPKTTDHALRLTKYSSYINQTDLLQGHEGNKNFKFQRAVENSPRNYSTYGTRAATSRELYGCHVNYYSQGASFARSYCGLVYSSETDDPNFNDGKSYCVFTGLDHEVFGQDFYFNLNDREDIKYNTPYHYRAFVCSVDYNGQAHIYYSEEVEPFEIAINTPPYAATTRTWVFGDQIWSDAIHIPVCNKETFENSYTEPQCHSYTENGKIWYYYNGIYVMTNQHAMCPSPWRVPTTADFRNLMVGTLLFPDEWHTGGGDALRYGAWWTLPSSGIYTWVFCVGREEVAWGTVGLDYELTVMCVMDR